jgi:hypothetical protein
MPTRPTIGEMRNVTERSHPRWSKRGVVLRILQATRRILKSGYGRYSPFDPSTRGKHVGIYSAVQRAMYLVENADQEIGHYKEYMSTAMAVVDRVQRTVLGTRSHPFWEEDSKNLAYGPAAKARILRIVDAAIRIVTLDDKLFS